MLIRHYCRGEPIPQKCKSNSRASPARLRSWNHRVCSKSSLFIRKVSKSTTNQIKTSDICLYKWQNTQISATFIINEVIWHRINSHKSFWLTKKDWIWYWSPRFQRNWLRGKGIGSGLACLKTAKGIGSGQVRLQELAHLYITDNFAFRLILSCILSPTPILRCWYKFFTKLIWVVLAKNYFQWYLINPITNFNHG